jgi:hypothetical protein
MNSVGNAGVTPNPYRLPKCVGCDKTRVKLWREYSVGNPDLLCYACLEKRYGAADTRPLLDGEKCQIDGWVPAMPNNDGSFWGYTTAPNSSVKRWDSMSFY